jgi:hypothetical protein
MNAELAKPIDQIILLINALADDVSRQERTLRSLARAVEWYKETTESKTPQQHQEIMDALKELQRLQRAMKHPYVIDNDPSCNVNGQPAFKDPHNPDLFLESQEDAFPSILGTTLSVKGNAVNTSPTEELYERLHEDHGA